MNAMDLWVKGDGVSRSVALLLLAMSVGSWVVILWKAWMMHRVVGDVARSTAAFWQAGSVTDGHNAALLFDRHGLVDALISATQVRNPGTLSAAGDASQQLTRVLRDALHAGLLKLQSGQVLLATVGATAPFVGLLGTVWGIYHALVGLSAGTQISIDQISGPVGEALIMTAVGLAVAIPAVLGYNVLGRYVSRVEAELEGFALDLRDLLLSSGASHR